MKNFYKKYLLDLQKNIYEKEVIISIGNESCDVDSFISSIVMAIIGKTVWAVNISQKIFKYKNELMYLTKYLGIPINEIIFYEGIEKRFMINNKEINFKNRTLRLIIVDHNITNIELPNVIVDLTIDHHQLFEDDIKNDIKDIKDDIKDIEDDIKDNIKDIEDIEDDIEDNIKDNIKDIKDIEDDIKYIEDNIKDIEDDIKDDIKNISSNIKDIKSKQSNLNIYKKNKINDCNNKEINKIIKNCINKKPNDNKIQLINPLVGSCTTLISKYFLKEEYVKSEKLKKYIARLLMIGISIDTKNLKKRAYDYDIEEFKKLIKISGWKQKKVNKIRKKLKRKIKKVEKSLTTEIILSKDFKKFKIGLITYGYSTVKYSFKNWVDRKKESLTIEEIEKFNKYQNLNFLFINYKNKNKRFLYISENFDNKIKQKLIEKYNFVKKRYKIFDYFEIPVEMSRKIMVPEIYKLYNSNIN